MYPNKGLVDARLVAVCVVELPQPANKLVAEVLPISETVRTSWCPLSTTKMVPALETATPDGAFKHALEPTPSA